MISGAVYVQCYFIERWIGDQIKYRQQHQGHDRNQNLLSAEYICNVLVLAILFFTSGNGIHNLALR